MRISSRKGNPRIGLTRRAPTYFFPPDRYRSMGQKDKQIDKQIDKPSSHSRSRLNWEHVLIGARHAHTDPAVASLSICFLGRPTWDVASKMKTMILIYMSNRHLILHV